MAGPLIAVTDSVFPSLDPAKAALSKLNPTYRMSKSVNADDIVAVAKDASPLIFINAAIKADGAPVMMAEPRSAAYSR